MLIQNYFTEILHATTHICCLWVLYTGCALALGPLTIGKDHGQMLIESAQHSYTIDVQHAPVQWCTPTRVVFTSNLLGYQKPWFGYHGRLLKNVPEKTKLGKTLQLHMFSYFFRWVTHIMCRSLEECQSLLSRGKESLTINGCPSFCFVKPALILFPAFYGDF